MYNEKVMTVFKELKNVGALQGANGIGKVGNAACGDIMKVYLKINNEGIIEDAKFKTFGCVAAISSTSVATEMVKGKTIKEALEIKNSDVIAELGGLPPQKVHCSVMAEEAIRAAIEDYYKRLEKQQKQENIDDEE